MIREKEKNNKEGQRYRLKKFEEEGYREAVSSINTITKYLVSLHFADIVNISKSSRTKLVPIFEDF
jgi:hypothetical protein